MWKMIVADLSAQWRKTTPKTSKWKCQNTYEVIMQQTYIHMYILHITHTQHNTYCYVMKHEMALSVWMADLTSGIAYLHYERITLINAGLINATYSNSNSLQKNQRDICTHDAVERFLSLRLLRDLLSTAVCFFQFSTIQWMQWWNHHEIFCPFIHQKNSESMQSRHWKDVQIHCLRASIE